MINGWHYGWNNVVTKSQHNLVATRTVFVQFRHRDIIRITNTAN